MNPRSVKGYLAGRLWRASRRLELLPVEDAAIRRGSRGYGRESEA